jgi:hypothetical protein
VEALAQKYAHVVRKRETKERESEKKEKEKETQKGNAKMNELRKEMGGNQDGSMGVYGGKKYEGLGSRDVRMRLFRSSPISGERRVKITTRISRRNRSRVDVMGWSNE